MRAIEDVCVRSDRRDQEVPKGGAGFDSVRVSSVVGVEGESNWKVAAELEQPTADKKETVVDDRDGKIVSYRQA